MKSQIPRPVELFLKVLRRKIYPRIFRVHVLPELDYTCNKKKCNLEISKAIHQQKPFMVARFGSVEITAIANFIGVRDNPHSIWKYIKGEISEWWWQMRSINQLQSNAGFFPISEDNVVRFCRLMIEDMQQADILGSWCAVEHYVAQYTNNAKKYWLGNIEPPYLTCEEWSWTRALCGKRVLVVHPFVETIKKQYAYREKLFNKPDFLPEFALLTVKAVQSIGGDCRFDTWFDALEYMKEEMDNLDYDVAIIGCGAYGLPLAAHAKRTGHVAIHMAGATQLLFGIRGKRWDNQELFKPLFNEYWVRPNISETPKTAKNVEGGCYW